MNINDFEIVPDNNGCYAINQVPNFCLEAQEACTVTLKDGYSPVFTGSYLPSPNSDLIIVGFEDIYKERLSSALPTSDVYVQSGHTKWFQAVWSQGNDTVNVWFQVSNARLKSADRLSLWAQTHFLTNQPKEKHITMDSPEWLTYYDVNGTLSLYAKVYPVGSLGVEYRITRNNQGVITANVSCQKIKSLITTQQQLQGYYDIILKTSGGTVKATQRYIVNRATGREHYFLFVNALGGIDTLICRGDNILQPEATFNTGLFREKRIQLEDTEDFRKWQQSMRIHWRQRNWIHELLTRKAKAAIFDAETGTQEEIVVSDMDFNVGDRENLSTVSFTYMMADNDETASDIKRETDDMLRVSSLRNAEIIITEEQPEEEEPREVDDPEEEVEP